MVQRQPPTYLIIDQLNQWRAAWNVAKFGLLLDHVSSYVAESRGNAVPAMKV